MKAKHKYYKKEDRGRNEFKDVLPQLHSLMVVFAQVCVNETLYNSEENTSAKINSENSCNSTE